MRKINGIGVQRGNKLQLKSNMEKSILIDVSKCPKQKKVKVFDNEGKLIANTNSDLVFLYILNEIRKLKLEGCYIIWNRTKHYISKTGRIKLPEGVFSDYPRILREMF